jgi:hypothetical protein
MLRGETFKARSRALMWITADTLRSAHALSVLKHPMAAVVAKYTKITKRWYVSVQAPSEWRPKSSRAPFPRKTKSFPAESEAKQFAKAMLSDGFRVTAGTLNPHQPRRRIITASEINQWIEEKE